MAARPRTNSLLAAIGNNIIRRETVVGGLNNTGLRKSPATEGDLGELSAWSTGHA